MDYEYRTLNPVTVQDSRGKLSEVFFLYRWAHFPPLSSYNQYI